MPTALITAFTGQDGLNLSELLIATGETQSIRELLDVASRTRRHQRLDATRRAESGVPLAGRGRPAHR